MNVDNSNASSTSSVLDGCRWYRYLLWRSDKEEMCMLPGSYEQRMKENVSTYCQSGCSSTKLWFAWIACELLWCTSGLCLWEHFGSRLSPHWLSLSLSADTVVTKEKCMSSIPFHLPCLRRQKWWERQGCKCILYEDLISFHQFDCFGRVITIRSQHFILEWSIFFLFFFYDTFLLMHHISSACVYRSTPVFLLYAKCEQVHSIDCILCYILGSLLLLAIEINWRLSHWVLDVGEMTYLLFYLLSYFLILVVITTKIYRWLHFSCDPI